MTTGPGDELAAAAAGRGRLRVSHADREQVIGTLKAAFVQGMLAKDEFDLRVSQAFASRTYAELAALTADLPAGLAVAQPPKPARTQDEIMQRPGRMLAVATALYAGVQAFVFLPSWPANSEGDPPKGIVPLFLLSTLMYLFAALIGVVNMVALRREKRSGGRPPRRPAPGAGGQASPRPPSASPGEELPPTGDGHQHTAEAERSRLPRPPGPGSLSPWLTVRLLPVPPVHPAPCGPVVFSRWRPFVRLARLGMRRTGGPISGAAMPDMARVKAGRSRSARWSMTCSRTPASRVG
jgi:hypothetical protein